MTDAEKLFANDVKEKKSVARSSSCKVRGGGKTVKMPSDYMTKKEKDALNGECLIYSIKPITWAEAKKMPDDIFVHYVNVVRKRYGKVPCTGFARMLGVDNSVVNHRFKKLGLSFQRGSAYSYDKTGFAAFIGGEVTVKDEPITEKEPNSLDIDIPETPDYSKLAEMLVYAKSIGATISISINL